VVVGMMHDIVMQWTIRDLSVGRASRLDRQIGKRLHPRN